MPDDYNQVMNKESQQIGKAVFELFLKLLGARLFSDRQAELFLSNLDYFSEHFIEESRFAQFCLKFFHIRGQAILSYAPIGL